MTTNSAPTLTKLLNQQIKKLTDAGIVTARLDALVIFEDVLSLDRAKILAENNPLPSSAEIHKIEQMVNRRTQHEPLAYIRKKANFYGREFRVSPHTLVPRPETETMIDLIKSTPLPNNPAIADVGCGCGCIGLTLALELQDCQVDLIDIDKACLQVARLNLKIMGQKMNLVQQDLLGNRTKHYDLLAANLPYVPNDHTINRAAMQEPKHAIFGGQDGLDVYRKLFEQIDWSQEKPTYVITESLPPQHQQLATIAKNCGFRLILSEDFIQSFKLL